VDAEEAGFLDDGLAPEVEDVEADEPTELAELEHQVLAAYSRAREQVLKVRQTRGYFKKPEPSAQARAEREARLKDMMKTNPCRNCGQLGHWSRDPVCPKHAEKTGGKAHSVNVVMSSDGGAAAMQTLRAIAGANKTEGHMVCTTLSAEANAQRGRIVLDIGCLRSVAGSSWAKDVIATCEAEGKYYELIPEKERFIFGGGESNSSEFLLCFEASFVGHLALLNISIAEAPCPPLFSRQACSSLGIDIKTGTHTMDIPKLAVFKHKLIKSPAGHYLVDVTSYAGLPRYRDIVPEQQPYLVSPWVSVYLVREGKVVSKVRRKRDPPEQPELSP
jgi:hypothetical protein